FVLPRIEEIQAPRLRLTHPVKHAAGGTPADLASVYASSVALITTREGVLGSGALISRDGLILTAAHVLQSDAIDVVFPGSGRDKHFRGEIVFVNDVHDVALIKAVGYSSERWFEVALDDTPSRGEPVMAIGNPAVGRAGVAVNAVSTGIVAKPYEGDDPQGLG